jgi:hypothetical protein
VPPTLVADYEAGSVTPRAADVEALRRALEMAGVEFIDGDQAGVRLRKG